MQMEYASLEDHGVLVLDWSLCFQGQSVALEVVVQVVILSPLQHLHQSRTLLNHSGFLEGDQVLLTLSLLHLLHLHPLVVHFPIQLPDPDLLLINSHLGFTQFHLNPIFVPA